MCKKAAIKGRSLTAIKEEKSRSIISATLVSISYKNNQNSIWLHCHDWGGML